MKKRILVSTLIALMAVVFVMPSMAQGKQHDKGKHRKSRTEKCEMRKSRKECDVRKGECCVDGPETGRPEMRNPEKSFEAEALKGITLSDEQKAKLNKRMEKQKSEFDKKQQKKREKMKKKADKQRKDAAKRHEKREKEMKKRMEKLDKDMKEILTPEQYKQFRDNVEKQRMQKR